MKVSLFVQLVTVCLVAGCASPKPETEFRSVPGPSDVPSPVTSLAASTSDDANQPAAKPAERKTKPSKEAKPAKKESKAETPAPTVTPDPLKPGKVMTYNNAGRFVVVNFPLNSMPAIGERVFVYRNDLKVGEAKVTGPRRDDNIVADLIAGEAMTGDEVRFK